MAKRRPPSKPAVPEWVVTYGDLMSLLLCFFILLAAFSELKQPREFRRVLEQIQDALGFRGGLGMVDIRERTTNTQVSLLEEMARRAEDQRNVAEINETNVVGRRQTVSVVHEGNRFAVGGSLPFEPGRHTLSESVKQTLRGQIAPQIRDQRYVVQIVGHAWGWEERTSGLDAVEISFRRAREVKEFLVRECGVDPQILRVEAAGETEPATLAAGSVDAARENRRVQVFKTGRTIAETHPDPDHTGRPAARAAE